MTFPTYDRDVIRTHCFGNFRTFLEDVAKSPAMLYYLDNASSRASPANENYARELFELHTLGAGHYLNHLYNRWREVPGALEGKAAGYIDQDVYEAARAFTGWTISDGTESGRGDIFSNTGLFQYYDGWHDNYQKRLLGVEFDPNQPPMSDGRKVLDLVAFHPGTARHLCTKLCRRLVADDPPAAVVDRAVQVWTDARDAPDQIAQTVRVILLSPEFTGEWGAKYKRPLELIASFMRATETEVRPSHDLFYTTAMMGYRQFVWPTPTGHPDTAGYWQSTSFMLARWQTLLWATAYEFEAIPFRLNRQLRDRRSSVRGFVERMSTRLLGRSLPTTSVQALDRYLSQGVPPDDPVDWDDEDAAWWAATTVALIAMTPEFQMR